MARDHFCATLGFAIRKHRRRRKKTTKKRTNGGFRIPRRAINAIDFGSERIGGANDASMSLSLAQIIVFTRHSRGREFRGTRAGRVGFAFEYIYIYTYAVDSSEQSRSE